MQSSDVIFHSAIVTAKDDVSMSLKRDAINHQNQYLIINYILCFSLQYVNKFRSLFKMENIQNIPVHHIKQVHIRNNVIL